ncbi:MAG: FAD-dependent oxidoreductase [Deltaproteobacteria bacterium]|nr:FAD-dependent oxidoreductase [Deltaproteobacteria bacterium]
MTTLLEPMVINGMELKNRVIMPPMVTNFATEDGGVTERMVRYYGRRARGGVGLVIVEMSFPHPTGKAFPCMLGVHHDRFIPGLNELAETIQAHGACAALQIGHAGRQTSQAVSGYPIVAPSPVPIPGMREVPKEMSISEIDEVIEAFGDAAFRAKRAGFDAVELHGTHGYLLNQFLSPYTNQRTDAYGGDFEKRMRFPVEVINEVRSRVGEHYTVLFRLCGNEYLNGEKGLTLSLAKQIAPRLVEAGVDMLHVTGGIGETGDHLIQPLYYDRAYNVYLAEGIKEVVGETPVAAAGSITDPHLADQILSEGRADLVAVGRGLIADPDFVNKTKEGASDQIRSCIRCNECTGRLKKGFRVSCTVNPMMGREGEEEWRPAEEAKKILVVGGGPAGMEAARILCLRGHTVTLCEKGDSLGGLLQVAAVPEWKRELLGLLEWLKMQLRECGVDIHLNTEATPQYVKAFKPDALILCTGSVPQRPAVPGVESALTAIDVLQGAVVGDEVIICGGGFVGCETGWYLAEQKKRVTIVEMLPELAMDMEVRSRTALLKKLDEHGVTADCHFKMEGIIPKQGVVGIDKEGAKREINGDTVVLATGFESSRPLLDPEQECREFYVIGDAKRPRRIMDAMREANHIARFVI